MSKDAEDPGQITATEYDKAETEALRKELRARAKKEPGGCPDCQHCGECRADLVKVRLQRQNTGITRVDSRVQLLLEKALAT